MISNDRINDLYHYFYMYLLSTLSIWWSKLEIFLLIVCIFYFSLNYKFNRNLSISLFLFILTYCSNSSIFIIFSHFLISLIFQLILYIHTFLIDKKYWKFLNHFFSHFLLFFFTYLSIGKIKKNWTSRCRPEFLKIFIRITCITIR